MSLTPTADKAISYALSQVGYRESYDNGHWTNREKYAAMVGQHWVNDQGQPWCDIFVWAVADQAGVPDADWPRSASCDMSGNGFKGLARWSEFPARGAQVFFGTRYDLNHTGLVIRYDDQYIWTVEGNTTATPGEREGNGVHAKKYLRTSTQIVGYGYPAYPEGIQSADPKWAKHAPKDTLPTLPKTRGKHVDAGITELAQANGGPKKLAKIKAALKALRSIKAKPTR